MANKKETLADRIRTLRKQKKLTQLELSEMLYVTDKAVSKWETNEGNPDISLLSKLAEIFDVSIDYLLTGTTKEKIVVVSLTEKIAMDDNVDDFRNVLYSELERSDEQGTTILSYIYKYKSKKIFDYYLKKHDGRRLLGGHYGDKKYIDEFILMCFETNNIEKISDSNPKAFLKLSQIYFEDQDIPKHSNKYHIKNDFIDYVLNNLQVLDLIMKQGDTYWANVLIKSMETLVAKKDPITDRILSFIEEKNEAAVEFYKKHHNSYYNSNDYILGKDGVYLSRDRQLIKTITKLNRQTVLNALKNNDYALANRLNLLADNAVSEHEIKMDKVSKNAKLSTEEKLTESVIIDGILDIDKLIALDNYKLYKKLIKLPASKKEIALHLLKEQDMKGLFAFAVKENMRETLYAVTKDRIEKLEKIITDDVRGFKEVHNQKYLGSNDGRTPGIGKETILFEDIINHKEREFFSHACKTDKEKCDWALEEIVKERSKEYDLIWLLLENGAMLHKRWSEDDGWGYTNYHDEQDETGTVLLRNQIEILMKEKK